MKAAGCFSVQMGVESGNNEILSAVRKNITIEEALDACRLVKKHGLQLHVFFMVGFPQETEATLRDTIVAMKRARSDVLTYSIFTPYPGTEAFELCREQGLIGDDYDVSLYNHQSPANHFCLNITPERFRVLVSKVEKSVDRRNWLNRMKGTFSFRTLERVQEYGIGVSLGKGWRLLVGK